MDVHIDWLSFTILEGRAPSSIYDLRELAEARLRKESDELGKEIFNGQGFTDGPGRPPYHFAMAREDKGVFVYGGSHTGTILFELSGRGCQFLHDRAQILRGWEYFHERVTRIDIAADVRTDVRPPDFCAMRSNGRFRTTGHLRSDSGETVYIGSPKSDRLLRVYRYDPPHPRSELLRSEFVFRRGMAQRACEEYLAAESPAQFIARAGTTYGLEHPVWQPGFKDSEALPGRIITKSNEGTVGWLYKQVAPAMRRLIDEGALDIADFMAYVYR